MASEESRVLRLIEPQGDPDIIECDGRLYVPEKSASSFQKSSTPCGMRKTSACGLPSLRMIVTASRVRNAAKS